MWGGGGGGGRRNVCTYISPRAMGMASKSDWDRVQIGSDGLGSIWETLNSINEFAAIYIYVTAHEIGGGGREGRVVGNKCKGLAPDFGDRLALFLDKKKISSYLGLLADSLMKIV